MSRYYVANLHYRATGGTYTSSTHVPATSPEGAGAALLDSFRYYADLDRQIVKATTESICETCNGTGKVRSKRSQTVRCPDCRGKDSIIVMESWIDLPAELYA